MLRQITELVPFGQDSLAKSIAVTYIANEVEVVNGKHLYLVGYFSDRGDKKFRLVWHNRRNDLLELLRLSYSMSDEGWFGYDEIVNLKPAIKETADIFIERAKEDLRK